MSKKKSVNPDESNPLLNEPIKPAPIVESMDIDVKRGRPSKYRPEFCAKLLEHMKKGLSFRSFAAVADVDFDTVYEWVKLHPDFADAKKTGSSHQLIWDENVLNGISVGAYGKSASAASHIFKMKNCHKWTDKVEVEQTNKNIEIKIDAQDAEL